MASEAPPALKKPSKGQPTPQDAHQSGPRRLFESILEWKEWIGALVAIAVSCWGALTYFATVNQLKAVDCNLHEMETQLNERMALFSFEDQIATYQHEQDEMQHAKLTVDDRSRLNDVVTRRKELEAKRDAKIAELEKFTAERARKCYGPLLYPSAETKSPEKQE